MDLKEIKAIIDLMKKNSLSEFELEEKDFKIKLKRPISGVASTAQPSGQQEDTDNNGYAGAPRSAAPVTSGAPAAPSTATDAEIKSPMIGTFYCTPSPDAAPYVEVGSEVGPDTVVCIIEAMKVMNEIKAEARGVITQILGENAKPVEFGQPLFKIRPL